MSTLSQIYRKGLVKSGYRFYLSGEVQKVGDKKKRVLKLYLDGSKCSVFLSFSLSY